MARDPELPEQVLLSDPLSNTVRKERRGLLAVSLLAIAVVKGHLMPAKLVMAALAFGIRLFIDLMLPVIVGVYALVLLWHAKPTVAPLSSYPIWTLPR